MGYDCYNHLPSSTNKRDVEEFLALLQYQRVQSDKLLKATRMGSQFSFYKEDDYKYLTGVFAEVYVNNENQLVVHTRTTIWRSKFDNEYHNFTIRQIKKRFGGKFHSDYGQGRYFPYEGPVREKSEAGCYQAFINFRNNLTTIKVFLDMINRSNPAPKSYGVDWIDVSTPVVISSNMAVPFLIAILEDYFRSTYIVLLRYSSKKLTLLKNARLSAEELNAISSEEMTVEEGVAKWMSFQDLSRICQSYKDLDSGVDVAGVLRKPYRRRKESLYEALDRIIKQRHLLIHQSELNSKYGIQQLARDVGTVEVAITRVYELLVTRYNWTLEEF